MFINLGRRHPGSSLAPVVTLPNVTRLPARESFTEATDAVVREFGPRKFVCHCGNPASRVYQSERRGGRPVYRCPNHLRPELVLLNGGESA